MRIFTAVLVLSAVTYLQAQEKFLGSIWRDGAKAAAPDTMFGTFFNQVTPANYGKWGPAEPSKDAYAWTGLDEMYQTAASLDLLTKQHTFIWGQQQPAWVTSSNAGNAAEDWIRDYMNRYGDRVDMIDVVNEPLHAVPVYKDGLGGDGTTGWDWVVWAFKKARQYAPGATLLINDYDILKSDYNVNRYLPIIRILQDSSLIDGIGLQAHFLEGISAAAITRRMNTLAATGLPLYISEYDCNLADDTQQLNVLKAQFTAFWEHPAVKGVTFWGHRQGQMWRTNAYLIRTDGTERPALTWLRSYLSTTTGIQPAPLKPEGLDQEKADDVSYFDINGRRLMTVHDMPAGIYLKYDGTRFYKLIRN